jgi:hypothetical protein
MQFFSTRINV